MRRFRLHLVMRCRCNCSCSNCQPTTGELVLRTSVHGTRVLRQVKDSTNSIKSSSAINPAQNEVKIRVKIHSNGSLDVSTFTSGPARQCCSSVKSPDSYGRASTRQLSSSPSTVSTDAPSSTESEGSERGLADGSSMRKARSGGCDSTTAVREFGAQLSPFELDEVRAYERVYFVGGSARKRRGIVDAANNCGFDDHDGKYIFVANDHIAYRYEVVAIINSGSFGQVIKAYDHKRGASVALKLVRNDAQCRARADEEVRILRFLRRRAAENVVQMVDHVVFRGHACIVFELLSLNLYELLKRQNFSGFEACLVRNFARSILQCLAALADAGIVHADLKPENIVLKRPDRSGLKVVDFGLSCFADKPLHGLVQTTYYRAPEVMLRGEIDLPIDMWSFGCILAELATGRTLFVGRDNREQVAKMARLLGMPADEKWRQIIGKHLPANGRGQPDDWKTVLGERYDDSFAHLLGRCLDWSPKQRLIPHDALEHPWMCAASSSSS